MATGLRLTQGALTLAITRFTDTAYPRQDPDSAEITYSLDGTPALEGVLYEKHFWSTTASLTAAEFRTLRQMYRAWLNNPAANYLLIDDYTLRIEEFTPRSRALATGEAIANEGTLPAGTPISYCARFKAGFGAKPEASQNGCWISTVLSLKELDKLGAS